MIPPLVNLQRCNIKRNTKRLQLRQIKHDHLLHIDKGRELLCPKGRETLWSLRGLNTRLDLLGPLQQVFFDCGSHLCGTGVCDCCEDSLVSCGRQLALTVAEEGKGAFDGLPEADGICDGVNGAER